MGTVIFIDTKKEYEVGGRITCSFCETETDRAVVSNLSNGKSICPDCIADCKAQLKEE